MRVAALALPLSVATLLVLYGIWWSWAETWHPDQMAFHSLFGEGRLPFEPGDFLKPPFHTYFNFFLSVVPIEIFERVSELIVGHDLDLNWLATWWSKILQLSLFVGTVYLLWKCCAKGFGDRAAFATALLLATSAGFVLHAHFLTTDVPVTFWMVLSFLFAQRIFPESRLRDYMVTGLLVGVATAVKYNGLAVGMAIPVFHWFAASGAGPKEFFFSRRLVLGVAMVPVGFVLANPYSLISARKFAVDFAYNYVTTPGYDGVVGGSSYHRVLPVLAELVGWPVALLVVVALVISLGRATRTTDKRLLATLVAAVAVVALYIGKFAAAPRLEERFLLPIVPFLLIAAAPIWRAPVLQWRVVQQLVFATLVIYNLAASIAVDFRLIHDPRMEALAWVRESVPKGSVFESTMYLPDWNGYEGIELVNTQSPGISGRVRVFSRLFADNPAILEWLNRSESDSRIDWYSLEALAVRRPEYLAVTSQYYERFLSGNSAPLYPEMNAYFSGIVGERAGYTIAFDRSNRTVPRWLYPSVLDFVDSRVLILRRNDIQ